jgi:hypothetical protein
MGIYSVSCVKIIDGDHEIEESLIRLRVQTVPPFCATRSGLIPFGCVASTCTTGAFSPGSKAEGEVLFIGLIVQPIRAPVRNVEIHRIHVVLNHSSSQKKIRAPMQPSFWIRAKEETSISPCSSLRYVPGYSLKPCFRVRYRVMRNATSATSTGMDGGHSTLSVYARRYSACHPEDIWFHS